MDIKFFLLSVSFLYSHFFFKEVELPLFSLESRNLTTACTVREHSTLFVCVMSSWTHSNFKVLKCFGAPVWLSW